MNFKQKLIYMALGCLFTLLGYTLATLNTNVTAQTDDTPSKAFDTIICRSLLITDEEGDDKIHLMPGSLFIGDGVHLITISGGWINITGKDGETSISRNSIKVEGTKGSVYISDLGVDVSGTDGKSKAILGADSSGGLVYVTDKNGTIVSNMTVGSKGGGLIQLHDQHKKTQIQLSFGDDGGHISFFNKGGENVLQAGVNEGGGGTIYTNDKHGYRTGSLP